MRKLIALLILCAAANLAGAPLMFRGNAAHTAVYPATSGRNLVGMQWRFPTGGEVNSSPIVAGDTAYIGSGDGKLYAIDLWTGAEKWSYDAGSAISSSPALADNTLYFATRSGTLLALGVNDRKIRWKKQTGADQPFPWGHESGDFYISSAVIDGDTVIFGAGDGNLYALNAANGSTRWTAATG
ncbi:MAG: outer membrane protein assembly factor BamB family protein, partial [Thermoanaerobaculia bacterium]